MDGDAVGFGYEAHAPDVLDQILLAHRLAGRIRKAPDQSEFARIEVERLSLPVTLTREEIQFEVAEAAVSGQPVRQFGKSAGPGLEFAAVDRVRNGFTESSLKKLGALAWASSADHEDESANLAAHGQQPFPTPRIEAACGHHAYAGAGRFAEVERPAASPEVEVDRDPVSAQPSKVIRRFTPQKKIRHLPPK